MWAQLIKTRLKPGKDEALERMYQQLRDVEQPGSGLLRSTLMRDQKDRSAVYMMVVFESEEKARARERDPRREEGLKAVRAIMEDAYAGAPEFVDLTVEDEVANGAGAGRSQDNIALFRRILDELANKGNVAIIDELFAPDFVEHEQLPPGIPAGREGVKALFSAVRAAFPDLRAEVEDVIAQDDRVVMRETWTGTHTGEYFGVPATGRQVSMQVVDIARFAHGKVVEHWGVADQLSLLQQLSAIPTPASTR
jgi:steroid delta-isomerase-like uncharacterized protein